MSAARTLLCPYFVKALAASIPIGGLAGLVGLGGGEFRLPVLMHVIGFGARAAVPLNLTVSLVTLGFALLTRQLAVPIEAVTPHLPEIVGLAVGGVGSAAYGTRLVQRLSDRRLVRLIAGLLMLLGAILCVEAFLPHAPAGLVPEMAALRAAIGMSLGLGIGVVSSVLGVAGGELLIPALMLVFDVDIKIAGTASLMISLVIVATGLWSYGRAGALPLRGGAQRIAASMSVGSMIGVGLGALAVALAPTMLLTILLGAVLMVAGLKTAASTRA